MRRRRRLSVADLPRLIIGGVVGVAGLFSGRYARVEGAHALVRDGDGRILVVRPTYIREWMLPGGRVERGETPHAAAARETLEETALEIVLDGLVLVDARSPRSTSFVFTGQVTGGALEPQLGEIVEAGWLDRGEIGRTSPGLDQLLAYLEDGAPYLGL